MSCKKDFLQRDTGVPISKEGVFSDATLAGRFADRSYVYRSPDDYGKLQARGQNFRGTFAELTDEAVAGDLNMFGIKEMNRGAWTDERNAIDVTADQSSSRGLTPYVKIYQGIRNCNVMLQEVDNVPWEQDPFLNKDLIKAQQLFLRAQLYYDFAKRWGGAFILDKPLSLTDNIDIPRSTFEETVAFIEKDLNEAEALFASTTFAGPDGSIIYSPQKGWDQAFGVTINTGETTGDVSSNFGRATLGSTRALRSRVLLMAASPLHNPSNDIAKWTKAADAAKKVIDMNAYALQPEYRDILEVPLSPEYIMIAVRGPRLGQGANLFGSYVISRGSGGTYNGINPTQNHVDLYETLDGRKITDPNSGYTLANPYANRDPRLADNVLYNTHPWQSFLAPRKGLGIQTWYQINTNGSVSYGIDAGPQANQYTVTSYYCRKYWPENLLGNVSTRALVNYVFFRYGEILLNYAEAINETGNFNSAIPYLDQIRSRAGMPSVAQTFANRGEAMDQAKMRDFIRNERAVELAFEDIRWWDILRWKKGPEIVAQPVYRMDVRKEGNNFIYTPTLMDEGYQRVFEDFMHLYPIPRSELIKSNGIVQQNPGWLSPY